MNLLTRLLAWRMNNRRFKRVRSQCVEQAYGTVLEIGAGAGANLPFYSKQVTHLTLLEPDIELADTLRIAAEAQAIPFSIATTSAEATGCANNSFDTVVSTWVQCSIDNLPATLQEIKRVLKPGGIFHFIEHGESENLLFHQIQKLMTPLWKPLAHGCELHKSYKETISNSGLHIDEYQHQKTSHSGRAHKADV